MSVKQQLGPLWSVSSPNWRRSPWAGSRRGSEVCGGHACPCSWDLRRGGAQRSSTSARGHSAVPAKPWWCREPGRASGSAAEPAPHGACAGHHGEQKHPEIAPDPQSRPGLGCARFHSEPRLQVSSGIALFSTPALGRIRDSGHLLAAQMQRTRHGVQGPGRRTTVTPISAGCREHCACKLSTSVPKFDPKHLPCSQPRRRRGGARRWREVRC